MTPSNIETARRLAAGGDPYFKAFVAGWDARGTTCTQPEPSQFDRRDRYPDAWTPSPIPEGHGGYRRDPNIALTPDEKRELLVMVSDEVDDMAAEQEHTTRMLNDHAPATTGTWRTVN